MQAKAFDDAIRARYEAGSFPAVQPDWEGFSMQLGKPARKRILWWHYPTAAAIVTAMIMLAHFLFTAAKAPQMAGKKGLAPVHATAPLATLWGAGMAGMPATALANTGTMHITAPTPDAQHGWRPGERTAVNMERTLPIVVPASIHDAGVLPVPVLDEATLPAAAAHSESRNSIAYVSQEERSRRGVSVSLLGGIESGSLQTGYMVGFSVHQPIGRHFSVGGSVTVVSAMAQQSRTLSASDYKQYASNANSPAFTTGGGTAAAATSNLYYLQLAPALRYALTHKLLVATGPDYQRLLQDATNKMLVYNDSKAQLAPINDFGWNSGLDYALTHHLQCGFRYRAGINNWLQPATGLLNRNYMQAHLSVLLGR